MKEIWNWIQLAIAAIGAFLGWFLGGVDGFLYALIAFVVIDYMTGVLCAIICVSRIWATPTNAKISTFLKMPFAPISLDSFLSRTAVVSFGRQ